MYVTDEFMQEYDEAQHMAQDGRDAIERYVSATDYWQEDRDTVMDCLAGMHTLTYTNSFALGRLTWQCEDCPRDITSI